MQDYPAAGLADALAAAVGEDDGPGSAPAPRCTGDVEQPGPEDLVLEQAMAQRGVQGDDRGLVRQGPRQVQCRAHGAGHQEAVDLDHLVVSHTGDVAAEHSAAVVPGAWPARDVHPVEWDVPERQTQEDRRRLVADDRGAAKARPRRSDQKPVCRCGIRRPGAGDVGATS
jgi:hypothetical protein